MNVAVIGLGKLGASMVAGFASKGISVIGYDINPRNVDALKLHKAPVEETDLQKYLDLYGNNVSATHDLDEAVLRADVSFVIVPTPSLPDNSFDLKFMINSCEQIGAALSKATNYHVVVITSTVLPGATRNVLIPALEKASGKKVGHDFGVCYNPEFIALGSVIRDFLNPDFYLVGEFDRRAGDVLSAVHARVSDNGARCKRLTIENAELAKISINSYVTLKISFANMLAGYCEKIEGGDIDSVTEALGMDSRIGPKYLKGGLGFAGPCFPRDNSALSQLGDKLGVYSGLLVENDRYNDQHTRLQLEKIQKKIDEASHITVFGLAYKPMSYISEKSPGIEFAENIASRGISLAIHDPLSGHIELCQDGGRLNKFVVSHASDALRPGCLVFLSHPTPEYINVLKTFASTTEITIVDFWRVCNIEFGRATVVRMGTDDGTGRRNLTVVYSEGQ
jgi:UDPglucose 6-dehydrogenase